MHHRITVLIANLFQLRNEPLPDITFNRRVTVLCGPHFDGRMTAIHPLIEFSPGQCHNSNYLHLWIDHNLCGARTIYTVALRNHPQLHLLPRTEVSNVRSTDLPEGMIQCSFDKRFCEVPKLFHGNGRYTPYVVFHLHWPDSEVVVLAGTQQIRCIRSDPTDRVLRRKCRAGARRIINDKDRARPTWTRIESEFGLIHTVLQQFGERIVEPRLSTDTRYTRRDRIHQNVPSEVARLAIQVRELDDPRRLRRKESNPRIIQVVAVRPKLCVDLRHRDRAGCLESHRVFSNLAKRSSRATTFRASSTHATSAALPYAIDIYSPL